MRSEWLGPLVMVVWFGSIYLGVRWFLRRTAAEPFSGPMVGRASWYGDEYRGKLMANGQPFDPAGMTCATRLWPLGTMLRVQELGTNLIVYVEVTDRGPAAWAGCIIDLSHRAFRRLADPRVGHVSVHISVVRLNSRPVQKNVAAVVAAANECEAR